ncbi:hypothetical protein [Streptomyces blattellae]|uniref:hypothetical protein n=1 Tax=Streptomyces blattellae TaxID=2569855 RepID=UPI0012B9B19F|nr:hypothetical protein [Streptomyces blattellae]
MTYRSPANTRREVLSWLQAHRDPSVTALTHRARILAALAVERPELVAAITSTEFRGLCAHVFKDPRGAHVPGFVRHGRGTADPKGVTA